MRIRQRPPVIARWTGVGAQFRPHGGGSISNGGIVTRTSEISHETFWDVVGHQNQNNPGHHTKFNFYPVLMDGLVSYDWNVVFAYGLPSFSFSQSPAVYAVTAGEKDALLTQLIRQWTNTPPPVINIGEYLTQFKQTAKIPIQAAKLITADGVWRPWARNYLKGRGTDIDRFATIRNPALKARIANETLANIKKAMKKAPSDVADGFLLWSFGIKPLLNDLQKLRTLVPDVRSRLQRLQKQNGTWTKHRTSRVFQRELYPRPNVFGAHEYKSANLAHGASCSLSVEVKTNYLELDGLIDELSSTEKFGVRGFLAVAQAIGLGNAPLVAWNAIPFSFVVDWSNRVGDHLDKYGLAQAEGYYETRKPLTTEKGWVSWELLYGNQVPSYTHFGTTYRNTPYVVGKGEAEYFTRTLSLPQPSFGLGTYLTPGQQMLLSALYTQALGKKLNR